VPQGGMDNSEIIPQEKIHAIKINKLVKTDDEKTIISELP